MDASSSKSIESLVRRLDSSVVISADSPIASLLRWMTARPFLFVVDQDRFVGLVTPSDVNKQAGRTYFYLLIAGLEMALAQLFRTRRFDQRELLVLLPPQRQGVVKKRLQNERSGDVVADPLAAMDFSDLLRLVDAQPTVRCALGYTDSTLWTRQFSSRARHLRNAMAHTVNPLIGNRKSQLRRLVETEAALRAVLEATEALVADGRSDTPGLFVQ